MLHQLTAKGTSWEWNQDTHTAFAKLKKRLTIAPVLGYPDPKQTYILDTDTSDVEVSQMQDEEERDIAYNSKTIAPPEKNYYLTRKELLAVVRTVKHFRSYLYGQQLKLRTDHGSLRWLYLRREPSNQVTRWLEILAYVRTQSWHPTW